MSALWEGRPLSFGASSTIRFTPAFISFAARPSIAWASPPSNSEVAPENRTGG